MDIMMELLIQPGRKNFILGREQGYIPTTPPHSLPRTTTQDAIAGYLPPHHHFGCPGASISSGSVQQMEITSSDVRRLSLITHCIINWWQDHSTVWLRGRICKYEGKKWPEESGRVQSRESSTMNMASGLDLARRQAGWVQDREEDKERTTEGKCGSRENIVKTARL